MYHLQEAVTRDGSSTETIYSVSQC